MRVAILWSEISGYMASCWRALAALPGFEVEVIAFKPDGAKTNAAFDPSVVLEGITRHRLLDASEREDAGLIADHLAAFNPEAVSVVGWGHGPYRRVAMDPRFKNAGMVMAIDTPWRARAKQYVTRFAVKRFFDRMDIAVPAGERAWQYCRRLGFEEARIRRGLYAAETSRFTRVHDDRVRRGDEGWPRAFMFVGRYVDMKGIGTLLEAYSRYRARVDRPWELMCCGMGAWGEKIRSAEGVRDLGFAQPDVLGERLAMAGCFVLASHYEPWGVALVEAMATGMPVICTEQVGAAVEVVRTFHNGLMVPTADAEAMARAMAWMHEHRDRLAGMGRHAREAAEAFGADVWAERWQDAFEAAARVRRGKGGG